MATYKRLTAAEAEPLFHAGVVMHFDANGKDDPEAGCVMKDYCNHSDTTASPLCIDPTNVNDIFRWWVEVE